MGLTGTEHIFYNHLLKAHSLLSQPKLNTAEVWPSVFLLLCLGLLVLVKMRAFPRVVKIVQSTYSLQVLQQLEREESNQFKLYTASLNLFFIFNVAFLAYKINLSYKYMLNDTGHLTQFLFFSFLVSLLYGLKLAGNKLLAFLSAEERLVSDYETSSALINQASGLFIFPWIVLVQFSKFNPLIFISGALITLAGSVLIKWYRGIIVSLAGERIGLLQIFTYFCGLEILPVIVMVKYVIETF